MSGHPSEDFVVDTGATFGRDVKLDCTFNRLHNLRDGHVFEGDLLPVLGIPAVDYLHRASLVVVKGEVMRGQDEAFELGDISDPRPGMFFQSRYDCVPLARHCARNPVKC